MSTAQALLHDEQKAMVVGKKGDVAMTYGVGHVQLLRKPGQMKCFPPAFLFRNLRPVYLLVSVHARAP